LDKESEEAGGWKKLLNENIRNLYLSPSMFILNK